MKRAVDFLLAVVILITLSPVLVILGLMVKITSKGPVFFTQRRIGVNRQEFKIFKFRTMYQKAPANVPTHLLDNPEKHITPIGRFLRKSSLDELPQLFNIIKGEMSFVGPRPALYNQYDLISLREKYNIHSVRPGITGWAQINGRDELEIPIKVEHDRYYVENKSLLLDFKIAFLTVYNVLFRKGIVEGKQQGSTFSG